MKVNTKFDIGDIVWYISNNKVCSGKIICVYCVIRDTGLNINYILNGDDFKTSESILFKSKDELLKSL